MSFPAFGWINIRGAFPSRTWDSHDKHCRSPMPMSSRQNQQGVKKRPRTRERVRVTRACDRCKTRKIKCDGTQPCGFCVQAKATCTFVSAYARGRVPAILATSDALEGNNASDNLAMSNGAPLEPSQQYPTILLRIESPWHDAPEVPSQRETSLDVPRPASLYAEGSSQNSPELSQTDLQGHYIGPASGVSFLLRIQKRLHQAISFSQANSIFTFGDAPLHLPKSDPSFCMMLPRADAQRLVDRYFDFAMPTYRFLHRPTLQEWFDEFYDTLGMIRDAQHAPARVALLFMVFAHARVYMPESDRPGPSDLSTRYFLAAEHQLTKEKGSIRLTSVQARLTQCYYLLTQSRINHCWSLFGTVSHLALAIGLNRNKSPDAANGVSFIEAECRRRTFWCAYTLDAFLSAALGRPRTFHDDEIDTELPVCIEDEDLLPDHMNVSANPSRGPSTMLAALAHMRLARIISRILSSLYSIKPVSAAHRTAAVKEISKDLTDWRADLARFVDVDIYSTSFLISIFQRQRNVLNLTYWHAVILTHRPFVLGNFARLSQKARRHTGSQDTRVSQSLKECLDAAMKTVNTINEITESRQLFRAFWITAYFSFNATIILYIYVIQECTSPPEVYRDYFEAATQCQSHISAIAEKGSLSERYCLVLEELRVEALRQTRSTYPLGLGVGDTDGHTQGNEFQTMSMPLDDSPATAIYTDLTGDALTDFNGTIPGFSSSDYSGWGQFTSMVSSGLGNMDMFLMNQ
ncbi:transcriptional regulatory protein GAL4 [Penicillium capsulatum]|uniref:Transcriptional regulatory protein GAL4 n=1 Tax=Penicillium capsulatum TaxID=69766 RepID=A0A9W9LQ74_9EURO|nr:transcriptional regulatory protein GAL4 [Penicillium capsulatum]KAJ6136450.1 transcriptional regulatory protein GAL4 [Penicillium capsulatum]